MLNSIVLTICRVMVGLEYDKCTNKNILGNGKSYQ